MEFMDSLLTLIRESERSAEKYRGYYFEFSTISLNRDFERVETGYESREKSWEDQRPGG